MVRILEVIKRLLIVVVLASVAVGCGYTFQGGGSVLPDDVKRVYIEEVDNQTTETKFTRLLTEALRDRFERYGVLTVVDSSARADAVLKTTIEQVDRDTRNSTANTDSALQNSITVVLASVLERPTGQVLWANRRLSATRIYGAAGNVVVTTSPTFSAGSLNAQDLNALSDREVTRGQEEEVFGQIAEQAALQVYEQAVLPEF